MSADADAQGAVRMGDSPQTPPTPQPTPTVSHHEQTASRPAGTAAPEGGAGGRDLLERPEAMVGGAFAGGLLAALILKRLGR